MHVRKRDGSELLHIRLQDIEAHNQAINILKVKGDKTHRVYLNSGTLQGGVVWSMPMSITRERTNPYSR